MSLPLSNSLIILFFERWCDFFVPFFSLFFFIRSETKLSFMFKTLSFATDDQKKILPLVLHGLQLLTVSIFVPVTLLQSVILAVFLDDCFRIMKCGV